MITNTTLLTCVLASLTLVGCESYRDSVRSAGSSLGAIQIRDIRQADAYRKALPEYLGLPGNRVRVEPGAGATRITILGEKEPGSKQTMIGKMVTFAETNYLGPIKLLVYPEDEMIWSKPTVISN
jgi:hypothetical protein